MSSYDKQIVNVCIQTFFNLHGYYPAEQDLLEMLGSKYEKLINTLCGSQRIVRVS